MRIPFFAGRRVGADVDEELSFHIEMKTRELVAGGLSPAEAREAARRAFGDIGGIRDDCVRVQGEIVRRTIRRELLASLKSDVRLALRSLRHSPGFATVMVLTLALGIGATATTFSMLDALLLKPLPYPEPENLGLVWERRPEEGVERDRFSLEQYDRLRASMSAFDMAAAFTTEGVTATGSVGAERLGLVSTTSSLLQLLGARPLHGRLLGPGDDAPGAPVVVVLSHELWQRRYGADPDVVGGTIRLDDVDYPIVGILSADFDEAVMSTWGDATDLFAPLGQHERGWGVYTIVGRKLHDRSWRTVQAELDRFAAIESRDRGQVVEIRTARLVDEVAGDLGWGLIALFGSAGILLLITCANVATLLLSRAPLRQQEMAVCAAIGASRRQLVRRSLVESVLIAAGAGILAIVFAVLIQRALQALPPSVEWSDRGLGGWKSLPWLRGVGIDVRVLGFTGAVTALTTLFFGLWPAMRASRADPGAILKGEGGAIRWQPTGRRAVGAQDTLLIAQVALTLVLLVGAGLLVRSFVNAQRADLGFNPEHVLTMYANPTGEWNGVSYATRAGAVTFYESVLDRVRSIPGVDAAAFIDGLPQAGSVGWVRLYAEGRGPPPGEQATIAQMRHVTPDYFRVMGIPLRAGRLFAGRDTRATDAAVVVDERLAERFWPGQDPVGRRVYEQCQRCELPATVIGVVSVARYRPLELDARITAYDVLAQHGDGGHGMYLVVKTTPSPESLIDEVREAFRSVDPNQPVIDVQTMEARLADTLLPRRLAAIVLESFALLALLLTTIGLYGSIMHRVTRSRHAIAICMALGAQRIDVRILVLRRAMVLTVAGLALGLLATFALTRLLGGMLYGVTPTDAPTFGLLAAAMAAVALLAAWVPAYRATRIDPMTLLRTT